MFLSGKLEDLKEIKQIIANPGFGIPFNRVLRKIDREINTRGKWMKLTERTSDVSGNFGKTDYIEYGIKSNLQSPHPEVVLPEFPSHSEQPESLTKLNLPRDSVSPTLRRTVDSKFSFERHPLLVSSQIKQNETRSSTDLTKQTRMTLLKTKMDEIADTLAIKRTNAIKDRLGRACRIVESKFQLLKSTSLSTLQAECSQQSTDDLCLKRVQPNYATILRLVKAKFPAAAAKAEYLLKKYTTKNALHTVREHTVTAELRTRSRVRQLRHTFSCLSAAAAAGRSQRTKDRVTNFVIKLDTFVLLLKYNAFFAVLAEGG